MLRLFPVTMAWVRESVERDREIRDALDGEWQRIFRATSVGQASG